MVADTSHVDRVEREPGHAQTVVVAGDAVAIQQLPCRSAVRRLRGCAGKARSQDQQYGDERQAGLVHSSMEAEFEQCITARG